VGFPSAVALLAPHLLVCLQLHQVRLRKGKLHHCLLPSHVVDRRGMHHLLQPPQP
jgi:hypothetical protein